MKFVVASILVATCAAQVNVDDFWKFDFDSDTCPSTDEDVKGCYENTKLDYSAVADCLNKHPGDGCLSHLTVTAKEGDQFGLRDNCDATKYALQEFDVEGFFFAITDYESISSSASFVVSFNADTVGECEMKIEFLPNPISKCENPKENNDAVVPGLTVTNGINSFKVEEVFDVFKTGKSPTTALVTYTDYSKCGQGVLSISYPGAIEFEFQVNPDQEPDTTSGDSTGASGITASDATTAPGTTAADDPGAPGEGDDGTDEGDDGTDEGDDGADEEDDGTDEGDDGTGEGDDGANEGDDGASEGDADVEDDTTDSSSVTIAVAGIFSVGAALAAL